MAAHFAWYELMTTDPKAAAAFYGKVVGWGTRDMPMGPMTYTMLLAGEVQAAGLMALPEEAKKMGARPSWTGYVGVPSVDQSADEVKRLGGKLYVPPTDIPNVGRFAVAADPQGAAIALFQPLPGQAPPPSAGAMPPTEPGRIGWHELLAADREAAFGFYSALFGWQKGEAMDMGEVGLYQIFSADGQMLGGMFTKPAAIPMPYWVYYFNVDSIDAAAKRIAEAGGTVLMGPTEIPGGQFILQCRDPQGAVFALLGKR